jgi:hypothetical protein
MVQRHVDQPRRRKHEVTKSAKATKDDEELNQNTEDDDGNGRGCTRMHADFLGEGE